MKKKIKEKIPPSPAENVPEVLTPPEKESEALLRTVAETSDSVQKLYTAFTEAEQPGQYREEVESKIRSYRRTAVNLRKAYYHIASVRDELSARWKDIEKGKKHKHFFSAPANAVIDLQESKTDHFAKGMNLYKVLLVCYIGSFVGVLIEMIWCLLTNGYVESRAGLVYGPFNLLYGVGAVAMTMSLYRFRNNGKWISFIGAFFVGSLVEYACSWVQEVCFGSRSWDYSHLPFQLNGRICLLYSVFWGLLGVTWVKTIYPLMAKLILKIPNKAGKIITWVLLGFFVINAVMSLLTVYRWSQRIHLVEPANAFWAWIDMHFPNARMERIFANMAFD